MNRVESGGKLPNTLRDPVSEVRGKMRETALHPVRQGLALVCNCRGSHQQPQNQRR